MREKIKDNARLLHMIEAIDNISEFTAGKSYEMFSSDKILKFAVIKNLEIIGEAAYLLSKEFKASHQSVEWQDMVAMRHILVHGYYQIKDEIVWATIESELLLLKEKIQEILNNSAAGANL